MLSDEEREAIEWLKRLVKLNKRDNLDNTFAEILLNLIEKQSKEIEELKEKNKILEVISLSFKEIQDRDKKWKDKIKAKIEDILNSENGEAIEKLIEWQSLLEKE